MSEEKHRIAAIPTHIKASVGEDGRKRPAHISARHRKVAASDEPTPETGNPVDAFITRHGGPAHLRESLEEMTPDQRAKLIDAMAHVGSCTTADVMKRLGIHEPETSETETALEAAQTKFRARMAAAKDDGVITAEEYDSVLTTLEEDGLEHALDKLQALRMPAPPVEAAKEELPVGTLERAPETAAAAESPAAAAQVPTLEVAGPADINTRDQADSLYEKHVDLRNKAVRQRFEIDKRNARQWRVPVQMTENADQLEREAGNALADWQGFCQTNGIAIDE